MRLYSEDVNAGQSFDGVTIVDPLVAPLSASEASADDTPRAD